MTPATLTLPTLSEGDEHRETTMIIATIGNTQLRLDTLKDAEALLDIASRATLVDTGFGPNYQSYHYVKDGRSRLAIEIIEGDKLLTQEEHDHLQAEREAKRAAEKSPVTTEAAA